MRALARLALAGALLGTLAGPVLAGASSAPFGAADPALRTATPGELEGRVKRSCIATQISLQGVAESRVHRPCGCYASRVMGELSPDEVSAYRFSGVFNDGARAKALAALDSCRLKRPV